MPKVFVKEIESGRRLSKSRLRKYHLPHPDASDDEPRVWCGKHESEQLVQRDKKYVRREGLDVCDHCSAAENNEYTVRACPECDDTRIRREAGGINKPARPAEQYRCEKCGHQFHKPVRRPAKVQPVIGQGIAAKLADPNVREPEDVVLND